LTYQRTASARQSKKYSTWDRPFIPHNTAMVVVEEVKHIEKLDNPDINKEKERSHLGLTASTSGPPVNTRDNVKPQND
jgi:hypothetical protein